MMASFEEVINDPYIVVNAAFEKAHASPFPARAASWIDDVAQQFDAAFKNPAALQQVPVLSSNAWRQGKLKPGSLVRYVGMVQDMFSPEPFFAEYQVKNPVSGDSIARPAAFRDSLPAGAVLCTPGSADARFADRTTLLCMPLPGQSPWCGSVIDIQQSSSPATLDAASTRRGKRAAGDGDGDNAPMSEDVTPLALTGSTAPELPTFAGIHGVPSGCGSDRRAVQSAALAAAATGYTHPLELGSTEPAQYPPALVRVYTGNNIPWRAGDAVEVVGIYTVDSDLYAASYGEEEDGEEEDGEEEGEDEGMGRAGVGAGHSTKRHAGTAPPSSLDMHDDAPTLSLSTYPAIVTQETIAAAFPEEDAAKNPPASVAPRLHALLMRKLPTAFPACDARSEVVCGVQPWSLHDPSLPLVPLPGDAQTEAQEGRDGAGAGMSDEARIQAGKKALLMQAAAAKAKARAATASRQSLGTSASAQLAALGVSSSPPGQTTGNSLLGIRTGIINMLASVLGGDIPAAEWALLWACSGTGTYGRMDALEMPLGRFSLCVHGFPNAPQPPNLKEGFALGTIELPTVAFAPPLPLFRGASPAVRRVHSVLSAIAPCTSLLPLRIDTLNGLRWFPARDTASERTMAGLLQCVPGTLIAVDETVLSPGKLEANGVASLSALQSVVGAGELPYDFSFGHIAMFEVDTPVLVLSPSGGAKSLLKTDTAVFLNPRAIAALEAADGLADPLAGIPESSLWHARAYFGAARSLSYSLPTSMTAQVQEDIVAARAANPHLTEADLHRLLGIARLSALSFGESTLTPERWDYALALERARAASVPMAVGTAGAEAVGMGPHTPVKHSQRE